MRRTIGTALLIGTLACGSDEPSSGGDGGTDRDAGEGSDAQVNDDGGAACADCAPDATCTDRSCVCNDGFTGNGRTCEDVDECAADNGGCDGNAVCTNIPGSRTCACAPGFRGDGETCASVWETLVTVPGLDISDQSYVVGAVNRVFFARGRDADFFKSIDVDTLVVRDETRMDDATNDFCACGLTATLVANDPWTILSFGNYANSYFIEGETWNSFAIPHDLKRGEAGGALLDDHVYLVGGRSGADGMVTDVPVSMDLLFATFEPIASFPVAVSFPAVAAVGGVLFAGGGALVDGTASTTFASYDPDANGWAILESTPFEANRVYGVALDDKVWVITGDAVYISDPQVGSWEPDPFPTPQLALWKPAVVAAQLYLVATIDGAFTLVHYIDM